MKNICLILLVSTVSGCCMFAPCSRYLSVTSEIKNHLDDLYQKECVLFIVDDGEKWDAPWSQTVSGNFSVLISIAPYGNKYALQLECEGFKPYITEVFNANDYSLGPYDMGSVNLVPET